MAFLNLILTVRLGWGLYAGEDIAYNEDESAHGGHGDYVPLKIIWVYNNL